MTGTSLSHSAVTISDTSFAIAAIFAALSAYAASERSR